MPEKFVGAHVSIAGGVENAPINAAAIGAKSFAMFLRSQRQWTSKPLEESAVENFHTECENNGYTPAKSVIPHGSYLLNCGSPNPESLKKSRATLIDEMERCERLGISLYNFHPGSTCGKITVDECIDLLAESINMAHSATSNVVAVLENMSGQGNTLGGHFRELCSIIDRVKDKSRMGVCIDTCHAFAMGYDLSSEDGFSEMLEEFERIIGFKYLKALHLNDSKGPVGCHLDRHENIGKGHIGLEGFRRVMKEPRFDDIPLILETPGKDTYEKEIKLLYSLL